VWYAGSSQSLRAQIEKCFTHSFGPGNLPTVTKKGPRRLIGLVSPHAGYIFSGPVAAHGYLCAARNGRPDSVIVLGPNHTGLGSGISIMSQGKWRTPFGDMEVDEELASAIQAESRLTDIDENAHRFEHSIEVQLPFLQYVYDSRLRFVPICMMLQDLQSSLDVGMAVARASGGKNVLVVASTDLTHYEPQKVAEANDRIAVDAMLKLDEVQLQKSVEERGISMCGFGPVSAAIVAAKSLGAAKAQLLCYCTSGDISQDYSQVVGYCSLVMSRQ